MSTATLKLCMFLIKFSVPQASCCIVHNECSIGRHHLLCSAITVIPTGACSCTGESLLKYSIKIKSLVFVKTMQRKLFNPMMIMIEHVSSLHLLQLGYMYLCIFRAVQCPSIFNVSGYFVKLI